MARGAGLASALVSSVWPVTSRKEWGERAAPPSLGLPQAHMDKAQSVWLALQLREPLCPAPAPHFTPWPCHLGGGHRVHRVPPGGERQSLGADHVPGIAGPRSSLVWMTPLYPTTKEGMLVPFTDETEAQRGYVLCLRSHSQ